MGSTSRSHIDVATSHDADVLTVELRGELDAATAPPLVEAIAAALDRATSVRMDLRGVTFCDSSGIRMLFQLRDHLASTATVALTGVPDPIERILGILDPERTLPIT
jgi:anti-anti-sigma factor